MIFSRPAERQEPEDCRQCTRSGRLHGTSVASVASLQHVTTTRWAQNMLSEPMLMWFATPSPLTLLVTRAQAGPTPIFCPPIPLHQPGPGPGPGPGLGTRDSGLGTRDSGLGTQDRAPCPCIRLRWIETSACIYLWGGVALTCPGVSGA